MLKLNKGGENEFSTKEELTKYKDTTLEIIKAVEDENYDLLRSYKQT